MPYTPAVYGHAYRKARAQLLKNNPLCHWCGDPATTADHEPPVSEAGPHLHLVPACQRCNLGRRSSTRHETKPSRDW